MLTQEKHICLFIFTYTESLITKSCIHRKKKKSLKKGKEKETVQNFYLNIQHGVQRKMGFTESPELCAF